MDSKGIFINYDGNDSYSDYDDHLPNNVLEGLPTREKIAFNARPELFKQIREDIAAGKSFYFMPTDVEEATEYSKGNANYVLHMFGCLISGDKAQITITGVKPSFDIMVPDGKNPEEIEKHICSILEGKETSWESIKNVYGKPLVGYREEKVLFKRVSFHNTWARGKAMERIARTDLLKMHMYSNDKMGYSRKLSRENGLSFASWAVIQNYSVKKAGKTQIEKDYEEHNCTFVITCKLPDIKTYTGPDLDKTEMKKDPTLVITWDAETHTYARTGQVPVAENPEDKFIEICGTLHWKNDVKPILRYCVTTRESMVNPNPDRITIMCKDQNSLLKGFAHLLRALMPDMMFGYNDGDYDWKFYLGKVKMAGLLAYICRLISCIPLGKRLDVATAEKRYIKADKNVKITAETSYRVTYLKVPGLIPVDSCIIYSKLYPRTDSSRKQSLNYYCKRVGLPGKIDVSITEMWKTFEAPDSPARRGEMELYVEYCVIDAQRTQQLMNKRNVIDENRDIAAGSYTTLFDAFYYAGGMKVVNLLGYHANRMNIMMPMIVVEDREKGKYPGAWVKVPNKGLNNKRPTTGIDAESLYPNMIISQEFISG